jgi:hypothetical protein
MRSMLTVKDEGGTEGAEGAKRVAYETTRRYSRKRQFAEVCEVKGRRAGAVGSGRYGDSEWDIHEDENSGEETSFSYASKRRGRREESPPRGQDGCEVDQVSRDGTPLLPSDLSRNGFTEQGREEESDAAYMFQSKGTWWDTDDATENERKQQASGRMWEERPDGRHDDREERRSDDNTCKHTHTHTSTVTHAITHLRVSTTHTHTSSASWSSTWASRMAREQSAARRAAQTKAKNLEVDGDESVVADVAEESRITAFSRTPERGWGDILRKRIGSEDSPFVTCKRVKYDERVEEGGKSLSTKGQGHVVVQDDGAKFSSASGGMRYSTAVSAPVPERAAREGATALISSKAAGQGPSQRGMVSQGLPNKNSLPSDASVPSAPGAVRHDVVETDIKNEEPVGSAAHQDKAANDASCSTLAPINVVAEIQRLRREIEATKAKLEMAPCNNLALGNAREAFQQKIDASKGLMAAGSTVKREVPEARSHEFKTKVSLNLGTQGITTANASLVPITSKPLQPGQSHLQIPTAGMEYQSTPSHAVQFPAQQVQALQVQRTQQQMEIELQISKLQEQLCMAKIKRLQQQMQQQIQAQQNLPSQHVTTMTPFAWNLTARAPVMPGIPQTDNWANMKLVPNESAASAPSLFLTPTVPSSGLGPTLVLPNTSSGFLSPSMQIVPPATSVAMPMLTVVGTVKNRIFNASSSNNSISSQDTTHVISNNGNAASGMGNVLSSNVADGAASIFVDPPSGPEGGGRGGAGGAAAAAAGQGDEVFPTDESGGGEGEGAEAGAARGSGAIGLGAGLITRKTQPPGGITLGKPGEVDGPESGEGKQGSSEGAGDLVTSKSVAVECQELKVGSVSVLPPVLTA